MSVRSSKKKNSLISRCYSFSVSAWMKSCTASVAIFITQACEGSNSIWLCWDDRERHLPNLHSEKPYGFSSQMFSYKISMSFCQFLPSKAECWQSSLACKSYKLITTSASFSALLLQLAYSAELQDQATANSDASELWEELGIITGQCHYLTTVIVLQNRQDDSICHRETWHPRWGRWLDWTFWDKSYESMSVSMLVIKFFLIKWWAWGSIWISACLSVFCDRVGSSEENSHYNAPTTHAPQAMDFKEV